ncbi:MAG: serine hydrolase domain-containing protein [Solirubrobacteraceae bacterium]
MTRTIVGAVLATLALAAPAQAAKQCPEPGSSWERATPAEAGMDAARLQDAIDYGTSQEGFAVRVYRYGCLVGEDRAAAVNSSQQFESWSMAKSVTSLIFGRAMAQGLISPDDPVGSLVPVADAGHGALTERSLLTMTSGVHWNGLRDYNIFTMPDRIRDALTLPFDHKPGTYFEYAQSPVSLLAETVGRSAGEDVEAYAQRTLMDPLGIPASAWRWTRDPAGHVGGFYGVNMRPDDFARLGELLRRGGVWHGHQLIARRYMREALTPTPTNGCYGWLIWVNAGAPCVSPRVQSRTIRDSRDFPDLPADMYQFAGLFGQLVTIFPSQGLLIVRLGQDPGLTFAGGSDWEHTLYQKVLGAVTDQRITPPGPAPATPVDRSNSDTGFQDALQHPDEYRQGAVQDPLPAAGPARARAAQPRLAVPRASRAGVVTIGLLCPRQWPGRRDAACQGRATLTGARRAAGYRAAPGRSVLLRFTLTRARLRALRRAGRARLTVRATNRDAAGGTAATLPVSVARPRR